MRNFNWRLARILAQFLAAACCSFFFLSPGAAGPRGLKTTSASNLAVATVVSGSSLSVGIGGTTKESPFIVSRTVSAGPYAANDPHFLAGETMVEAMEEDGPIEITLASGREENVVLTFTLPPSLTGTDGSSAVCAFGSDCLVQKETRETFDPRYPIPIHLSPDTKATLRLGIRAYIVNHGDDLRYSGRILSTVNITGL